MPRDDAKVAQLFADFVSVFHSLEEPLEAGGPDLVDHAFWIDRLSCLPDRDFADVGREDLKSHLRPLLLEEIRKIHCKGIGFFAGRTTRDPYSNRLVLRAIRHERREHHLVQRLERLRIAKELSDVDEQIIVEVLESLRARTQVVRVRRYFVKTAQAHPALDTSPHGRELVVREVDLELRLEKRKHAAKRSVGNRIVRVELIEVGCVDEAGRVYRVPLAHLGQRVADLRWQHDAVGDACGDRSARRIVEHSGGRVLNDDRTALRADGSQPIDRFRRSAREKYRNGF